MAYGQLGGFLTAMPRVADTGEAEAHQHEGGRRRNHGHGAGLAAPGCRWIGRREQRNGEGRRTRTRVLDQYSEVVLAGSYRPDAVAHATNKQAFDTGGAGEASRVVEESQGTPERHIQAVQQDV